MPVDHGLAKMPERDAGLLGQIINLPGRIHLIENRTEQANIHVTLFSRHGMRPRTHVAAVGTRIRRFQLIDFRMTEALQEAMRVAELLEEVVSKDLAGHFIPGEQARTFRHSLKLGIEGPHS